MKKTNIFESIPPKIQEELFEEILSNEHIVIERIVSYGHTSPKSGWYNQERDEWVMVLEGEAVLCFEDEKELRLKAGDYLNIPAHTKHKVSWTKPECKTVWLAIHYQPR
ncbi:cupin domain-containing protein [bacterium]|nr:cupin domain-containing protein [bacterium]MBU1991030.1 cupin domain-containing protein [bacterium]